MDYCHRPVESRRVTGHVIAAQLVERGIIGGIEGHCFLVEFMGLLGVLRKQIFYIGEHIFVLINAAIELSERI